MKHRPFSELTKHWPPERTAKIEARVDTALAELDRQERERTADERPSPTSQEIRTGVFESGQTPVQRYHDFP